MPLPVHTPLDGSDRIAAIALALETAAVEAVACFPIVTRTGDQVRAYVAIAMPDGGREALPVADAHILARAIRDERAWPGFWECATRIWAVALGAEQQAGDQLEDLRRARAGVGRA
jgi:hypothetical protein